MSYFFYKKMHGLENDFVIIDSRDVSFFPNSNFIKSLSERKTGLGFDQLIIIENVDDKISDCKIKIYNADGTEAENCGNALRCVGRIMFDQLNKTNVIIETKAGLIDVEEEENGLISVDMGLAKFSWNDIPLSHPLDTSNLDIDLFFLKGGYAINMGNPHVVFFVKDMNQKFEKDCQTITKMNIFPEGVNINIAKILSKNEIELKVYERGCGFTRACGTGACATATVALKLKLSGNYVTVKMPGGVLNVNYLNDGHVIMTGPVSMICDGKFNANDFLGIVNEK
ncbi:MAG: diaminopimelate epimerase [Rickettsiales bacterium TMED254]|nr:diaminopimelate epimerase [Rickettsiales bacterium]RPF75728.1 MAG: diaminopimelate epimerase [Rickettsiales bacterium TMED254]